MRRGLRKVRFIGALMQKGVLIGMRRKGAGDGFIEIS
jgi:hypothetical protein